LVIVTDQAERTLRRPHPRVVPTDVFVVVTCLGAEIAGRLVDALPVVVQRYRCGNAHPSRQVLARFNHIATIIAALAPRPNDEIVAWFATPSPDLSGRSPADILANPWEPSDLLAALVLEVARSDDNILRSQVCQTT
jgi:hypothetical protein